MKKISPPCSHKTRLAHRILRNQAAYSLIEVLVALVVACFSASLIFYLLNMVMAQFTSLQNTIKNEIEMNELVFTVEHYLGMGVDVEMLTGATGITPLFNNRTLAFNAGMMTGAIVASYNLGTWTPTSGPGAVDVIGYFLRDTLKSGYFTGPSPVPNPQNDQRFLPTGIFLQRPTINKYGVLYVTTSVRGGKLSPKFADYIFEGIVDFTVRDINYVNYKSQNKILSVTFDVTQRHYLASMKADPFIWCPPKAMSVLPGCTTSRTYSDTTKTFTVKLRNNIIGTGRFQKVKSTQAPDPVYGPKYDLPARRPFENIYFLRPNYPTGSLKR